MDTRTQKNPVIYISPTAAYSDIIGENYTIKKDRSELNPATGQIGTK